MQQQKHLLLTNIAFKRRPRVTFDNKCANCSANKCKMWPNCAFHDKSVKFGTNLEYMLTSVFSYRAIADLSCDPSCAHLLSDVIKSVCAMFSTKDKT